MNLKKLLSLAAATAIAAGSFAAMAVTANAASVDDAATITADMTYWFDDANGKGTTKINGDTVFGNYFYTPYGHNAANNKGKTTVDGVDHLNSLRVKSASQDRFAFKVGAAATITFYTQSHKERGLAIAKDDNYVYTDALAKQEYNTETFVYTIDSAQTVYVTANSDFFIAGVSVDIANDAPVETDAPAETQAPVETDAPTETQAPEIKQIPLDTVITFADDGYKTYIELGEGVSVSTNNATYGDVSYTYRIGFPGALNSTNNRYVTFTPAESGILEVIARGGNGDRPLAIKQSEADEQTNVTTADTNLYTYTVEAGVPVTMYSTNSSISVYSIKLVEASVEPETTTVNYAFEKTIDENGVWVTVEGTDNGVDFKTDRVQIFKDTHFTNGGAKIGIILNVPEGMTVTNVTID